MAARQPRWSVAVTVVDVELWVLGGGERADLGVLWGSARQTGGAVAFFFVDRRSLS